MRFFPPGRIVDKPYTLVLRVVLGVHVFEPVCVVILPDASQEFDGLLTLGLRPASSESSQRDELLRFGTRRINASAKFRPSKSPCQFSDVGGFWSFNRRSVVRSTRLMLVS